MKRTLKNMAKVFVAATALHMAGCGVDTDNVSTHKAESIRVNCGSKETDKCVVVFRNRDLLRNKVLMSKRNADGENVVEYNDSREGNIDVSVSKDTSLYDSKKSERELIKAVAKDSNLVTTVSVRGCDNGGNCAEPHLVDASDFNGGGSKQVCETRTRSIEVFCKDPKGNLQSGCEVKVEDQNVTACVPSPNCTTDDKGRCSVDAPEGTHTVTVSKKDQKSISRPVSFDKNAPSTASFRLKEDKQ